MKITYTARKVNLKDNFKELCEKKLAKFQKIFSEDAEASVVVTLYKNRQTVEVTVKDNGRGVRDNKGNIVSSTDIFSYGYSTKGDPKLQPGLINRILNKFRLDITGARTVRGVGLSINKELLQSYNGDITLHETSPKGTTFIVKIPVKKTEKKNS